jgi:putative Mn2+ efflux pump MntP
LNTITLIAIAISLAMDAFAVSISTGAYLISPQPRQVFRMAFHFGFFQFIMPITGWVGGYTIIDYIRRADHWIAAGLLIFVGVKMIQESFRTEKKFLKDPTRGFTLVVLSIATSLDAMAIGFTLSMIHVSILYPSIIIGLTAAIFSVAGIYLGSNVTAVLGKRIETLGGIVLFIIAGKILIEHLTN